MKKGEIVIKSRGKVEDIDDLVSALVLGGGKIDELGDLIINLRKGLLRGKTITYTIEFGMVKGLRRSGAFFSVREEEGPHPIFIVNFLPVRKGAFKARWECVKKDYTDICKEILKILKKGLKKLGKISQPGMETPSRLLNTEGFRLSNAYQRILDGMAEVTLATALLKYPLILKLDLKVEYLRDIPGFLDFISKKVGDGNFIILTTGKNWKFIIGLNNPQKEYTPSFISLLTGERLLGGKALERINTLESSEQVKVMIFKIPEGEMLYQN